LIHVDSNLKPSAGRQEPNAIATDQGPDGVLMTVPLYINESKSDMRSIKSGWYAMDDDGSLVSGPFSSREKCVERDDHPTDGSMPSKIF
jgi:hypothetical protein